MSAARHPRHHLLTAVLAERLEAGGGDEPALVGAGGVLSRAALAAVVEELAAELDDRVPPGSRVAIASRDQCDVAVAFLAALRSRSIPLLADPESPAAVAATVRTWRVAGGIGDEALFSAAGVPVVPSARLRSLAADPPPLRQLRTPPAAEDEPAFWTFTSGTTGEPRAIVHAHRGPSAAYDAFAVHVLRLGAEDATIATAGLPFVYALGNALIFPLIAGAAAILPPDLLLPTVLDAAARHGATVLAGGPWSLGAIVRSARKPRWQTALRNLRLVLSAGEPLPARLFEDWRARFGKPPLDNLGSTEMFNSFVSNHPGDARPGSLGRPVPGFEVNVGGAPPRPGARGALRVRGPSRAIGTLSPADPERIEPAGAWCETGDEVAVDGEGRFVFLGRSDERVKVKGRFVRPVEIERRLCEVAGVAEALVSVETEASGLAKLVARVVPLDDAAPDLSRRVLEHARRTLERFVVPARVDVVEALPRSARGKLRRPRIESSPGLR